MTAADTHAAALAALAAISERRAKVEAAPRPLLHFYPGQCCAKNCLTTENTFGGIHNIDIGHDLAALIVQMRSDYEALLSMAEAVLERHKPTENPTHGCCAAPKLCNGHAPECRWGHGLNAPAWPCADASAVLAALNLNPEEV